MYSSTCFGRPHAHHQELNNCSSTLWFYCWSVVVAVQLVMVGPVMTGLSIQLSNRSNVRIAELQGTKFRVCKSVHHHIIQINQPTRCNNFSSLLLLDVYVQLNMFQASSSTSSGAQQRQ